MLRTLLYVCLFAGPVAESSIWLASFDQIWQTIADKHYDPKLNGADWEGARRELRPKVEAAKNLAEARGYMNDLLARLGHSHVGVVPADVYGDLSSAKPRSIDAGLRFEIIGGDVVIAAGPHSGWILKEINGRKLRERIEQAKSKTLARLIVRNLLRGEPGEKLEVVLEDPKGMSYGTTIEVPELRGPVARLGHIPPLPLDIHFEKLASEYGYIRISAFFEPDLIEKVMRQAVEECGKCNGLILDLRENPGGIAALSTAVAGWFFEEPVTLGTMKWRTGEINLRAFPRLNAYRGKLALLVNGLSGSTSEILAAGMKDLKRARLFGDQTAGAALPSTFEKLPTGDGFQYVLGDLTSTSGFRIEGQGVKPDVLVEPTRAQLLTGRDAVRAAAIEWIQTKD